MAYPTTLDSFTAPNATDPRNAPSLAGVIVAVQTAIAALEAKLGINGSAVTSSIDYKLTNDVRFAGGATALTDASTVATDASLGGFFTLTIGGNRTLGAPTNLTAGFSYCWKITQGGGGSNTLAYNSVFKWAGGTAGVLSTAAGAIDILTGISDGTNIYVTLAKAFS